MKNLVTPFLIFGSRNAQKKGNFPSPGKTRERKKGEGGREVVALVLSVWSRRTRNGEIK